MLLCHILKAVSNCKKSRTAGMDGELGLVFCLLVAPRHGRQVAAWGRVQAPPCQWRWQAAAARALLPQVTHLPQNASSELDLHSGAAASRHSAASSHQARAICGECARGAAGQPGLLCGNEVLLRRNLHPKTVHIFIRQ